MTESITVTFKPDEKSSYTYKLPEVVAMSNDLSQDLKEQASKYLWFAALSARLVARRDHISNSLKTALAEVELQYRKLAEDEGKKTTEATIKAQVEADHKIITYKNALLDAEGQLSLSYSIVNAFAQRKDMLVALGANRRAEMNALNVESLKG